MSNYITLNRIASSIFLTAMLLLFLTGCSETPTNSKIVNPGTESKSNPQITCEGDFVYGQVNLVADRSSLNPVRIDPLLDNAWGMAIEPSSGNFCLASNAAGSSVFYDNLGNKKLPPISIPTVWTPDGGIPTGVVYNSTAADFVIPSSGQKSTFIFAQDDGLISAWSSGYNAIVVANMTASGAVYKGLAIGKIGKDNYLYATNFHGQTIDVFDKNFNYSSTITFKDKHIPPDFSPFGIANIDGKLFVTYAKLKPPDNRNALAGQGYGYVVVYKTDGTLIDRIASRGLLNAPWGIVEAPDGFCKDDDAILVGNNGDGKINIISKHGEFREQLKDSKEHALSIDGLWGLAFIPAGSSGNRQWLYFTAGPNAGSLGLFGYLSRVTKKHNY
ncbi:MAG: TIGR03118 family protein [FCB group bacterium]